MSDRGRRVGYFWAAMVCLVLSLAAFVTVPFATRSSSIAGGLLILVGLALIIIAPQLTKRAVPEPPDLGSNNGVGYLSRDRVAALEFDLGGRTVTFARDRWTGRAELEVGGETVTLQSPWQLSTHFSLDTVKVWRREIDGRQLEVEMQRERMWGGLKANLFIIRVDGEPVPIRT